MEDYAVATLELETGAAVRLACSWRLQAGCDAMISAAFYGTEGGAALRNVDGSFYDFVAERYRGTARETLATPPDAWGGRAAADWARAWPQGSASTPRRSGWWTWPGAGPHLRPIEAGFSVRRTGWGAQFISPKAGMSTDSRPA